jgi:uncharacterized protein (TIGR02453 family)
MPMPFQGFTTEALQFLHDLCEHNDRDWFAPRKPFYETEVKAPMIQLIRQVAAACQKKGFPLFPKEPSPVSRIYRDIRFSPDKRPFHHHVGAVLHGRTGPTPFGEAYLHVSPEQSFVAAGFYMPDPAFLRLARARIAERPDEFEGMVTALRKKALDLSRESQLKRMPRGFERFADSAIADHLKLNSFVVSRMLEPDEVATPRLARISTDFALAARPLLEWGWSLGYRPAARRESDLA